MDIATSLLPFTVVLDSGGKVIGTDAVLDGAPPNPPSGFVQSARDLGRDQVTWQPRDGVRIAAVIVPWNGGAVLVGRSLREVEARTSSLFTALLVGGVAMQFAVAIASFLGIWLRRQADT